MVYKIALGKKEKISINFALFANEMACPDLV